MRLKGVQNNAWQFVVQILEMLWTLVEQVLELLLMNGQQQGISNCVFDHEELITQLKLVYFSNFAVILFYPFPA